MKIMTENTCAVFTLKDLARTAYIECNEVVYRIWKWCKKRGENFFRFFGGTITLLQKLNLFLFRYPIKCRYLGENLTDYLFILENLDPETV